DPPKGVVVGVNAQQALLVRAQPELPRVVFKYLPEGVASQPTIAAPKGAVGAGRCRCRSPSTHCPRGLPAGRRPGSFPGAPGPQS
nr:hypothetical protein [Tanacetum cinerariifolium]